MKELTGWGRFCRLLGVFGVAVFFISGFTPVPSLLSDWLSAAPQLEQAQAIVVLGAGMWSEGLLSDGSMRRAIHGIVHYKEGLAPILIFSGPPHDEGPSEAQIRADLARALGVPPEAILIETDAWTTREEALRIGAVLQAKGVRKILLVTEAHHMARARTFFERAGFEVLAAPTHEESSRPSSPEGDLRLMRRILQEFLAYTFNWAAGYL